MATEPTQMITGDVMELHHLIYAERLAHAAEVGRLRAALTTAERFLAHRVNGDFFGALNGFEAEGYTLRCVKDALASDPGPLVAAVEGMKTTLEFIVTALCVGHGERTTDPTCEICQANARAQAALAAYRAALGGDTARVGGTR